MNQKNKPLVTVVTVTHNLIKAGREEYFRQCLESVHNQTYKNIEHIVIDGASTDGTVEIIEEYKNKNWIEYSSRKDDGIYYAMNRGIEKANGKYIAFLNSDDFYSHDDVISLSVKHLEKSNGDFSYGNCVLIYDDKDKYDIFKGRIETFLHTMPFAHPTMFTRTDIIRSEGMFHEEYGLPADYALVIKLIFGDYKGIYIDNNMVNYRTTGLSSVENYSDDIVNIYIDSYANFLVQKKQKISDIKRKFLENL